MKTIIDILRDRAGRTRLSGAFRFLSDDSGLPVELNYGDLDAKARRIAAALQNMGMEGRRCLLVFPAGPEFVSAFFGCLYAGVIAVPTHIPDHKRFLTRFGAITRNAGAELILSTSRLSSKIKTALKEYPLTTHLAWLDIESVNPGMEDSWRESGIPAASLAYLQYTSGSTSDARGVMISHGNIIANSRYITRAVALTEESVSACWLPHFHDMGLVDGILLPVHTGYLGILLSPQAFLNQPYLWLKAISDAKATHGGGPNFGFEHCLENIPAEKKAGLRLDSWESAYSGSETVRKDTLDRFAAAFASCGFRKGSFYPCYGLAEATLMVTGGDLGAADKLSSGHVPGPMHVGCGHVWPDTEIAIVDPETRTEKPEGREGEIWVKGDGVAMGYWSRPEETEQVFGSYLSDPFKGPFLRTGDLGFQEAGELYITGRLKDLVIIRGSNFHPQDIEFTLEVCDEALKRGRSAAFSVDTGMGEDLVIMAEIKRSHRKTADPQKIIERIRAALSEAHGLSVSRVVLLNPGHLPMTSSGKVRRSACRELLLSGEFTPLGSWDRSKDAATELKSQPSVQAPLNPVVDSLVAIFRELLGPRPFGIHDRILELGMDSLLIGQLSARIKSTMGLELPMETFFENPSIAELAALVDPALGGDFGAEHSARLPVKNG